MSANVIPVARYRINMVSLSAVGIGRVCEITLISPFDPFTSFSSSSFDFILIFYDTENDNGSNCLSLYDHVIHFIHFISVNSLKNGQYNRWLVSFDVIYVDCLQLNDL